ncbi:MULTISPECIES: hypothetical protein [unclassified Herbaspirillum]|uniref:hypothetical protein n=1 Tax=unclassified Herbaspirillum TaxID=2624150 RepID=UPI0012F6D8B9|nr:MULTISPECIES: hypothetical protein [unclassified Herbaspirillum]MCI1003703.1 hypothetical protein [Herbaspirillum sp. C7C8]
MIPNSFFSNVLRFLALLGGMLFAASGPDYLRGTISYGLSNNWHFQNVSGWGFRFGLWFQLLIIGLVAVSPFWVCVKNDTPPRFLPKRKTINLMVGFGLIFFLFSAGLEILLKTHFP